MKKPDYNTYTKEKLIMMLEKVDEEREAAKGPAPHRQFLYREDCPEGKIFVGQEEIDKQLAEGWLDTPAKIGSSTEELKGPDVPETQPGPSLGDKVSIATSLAKGSGLSHTAWMKALGLDPIKDREKTRKEYGEIVENFEKVYGESTFSMTPQKKWFIKE